MTPLKCDAALADGEGTIGNIQMSFNPVLFVWEIHLGLTRERVATFSSWPVIGHIQPLRKRFESLLDSRTLARFRKSLEQFASVLDLGFTAGEIFHDEPPA